MSSLFLFLGSLWERFLGSPGYLGALLESSWGVRVGMDAIFNGFGEGIKLRRALEVNFRCVAGCCGTQVTELFFKTLK